MEGGYLVPTFHLGIKDIAMGEANTMPVTAVWLPPWDGGGTDAS